MLLCCSHLEDIRGALNSQFPRGSRSLKALTDQSESTATAPPALHADTEHGFGGRDVYCGVLVPEKSNP